MCSAMVLAKTYVCSHESEFQLGEYQIEPLLPICRDIHPVGLKKDIHNPLICPAGLHAMFAHTASTIVKVDSEFALYMSAE